MRRRCCQRPRPDITLSLETATKARAMLETIIAYKAGIGLLLSWVAATVTVIIFQIAFEFSPFVAVLVGVLAFVTVFVLWSRFLVILEGLPPERDE
jgi:hypothetical protein